MIARAVLPALLAATAATSQSPHPATALHVPLREGLRIVEAHHDPAGDFEPITTVTSVDARGITVALSTDEPSDCAGRAGGTRRSFASRFVFRDDLENARAYQQEFTACTQEPAVDPGRTAIGVSTSVLRELEAKGETNLSATTRVAGLVPGVLTRVERETVPFKLIVNDQPAVLPAVHARWQSKVGAREYWILDDTANPLMLRGSYNGTPFLEVVKLSFPTPGTPARVEHALATQGRAVVYGIYFDSASDRIKEESDGVLADIAAALRQNPGWSLAIEGHTDSLGGDAYNLDLSQRRATAVKQALVGRFHVDGGRLQTGGFGASKPKDTNETLEGRARNRRVELVRMK